MFLAFLLLLAVGLTVTHYGSGWIAKIALPLLIIAALLIVPSMATANPVHHGGGGNFHGHFNNFRFQERVVFVEPAFVQTPSLAFAPSYDPGILVQQDVGALYQQYSAGCATAQIEAVPFVVFRDNRHFFRGNAREFNLHVGPRGVVRGPLGVPRGQVHVH